MRLGDFDAREVLGREVPDAEALARRAGCSVQVVKRDSENLPGIVNLDPSRIDVVVEDGIVTRIDSVA
jgi:hypothetical protein